jgi:hypothetical protein
VVGGLALVMHGIDRLTADVDLAVDLGTDALRSAILALQAGGLRSMLPVDPLDLADPAVRLAWQRDRGMQVFGFWDPTHARPAVDLFVSMPIDFEELWRDARPVDFGGPVIRVASIRHLIRMKELSGRAQDERDVAELKALESATRGDRIGEPPLADGSFAAAVEFRRWSFRQRTPSQRLEWLRAALEIAYLRRALQPRKPATRSSPDQRGASTTLARTSS